MIHHILDWHAGQLACQTREHTPSATPDQSRVTCPECRARTAPGPQPSKENDELRSEDTGSSIRHSTFDIRHSPQDRTRTAETEKAFMQQIIDEAKAAGWLCYHTYRSKRSPKGFPDLCLTKAGHPVLFAECKTDRGTLTPEQTEWLETLNLARGEVETHLWRPQDWAEIVQTLHREGAPAA